MVLPSISIAKPAGYKIIRVPLRTIIRVPFMEFSSNVTRRVLPARGSRTQRWSIQAHQRGINAPMCYALGCESLWITDRSPLSEESRQVRDWFTVNWSTGEFQSVVLNFMKITRKA